VTAAALTLAPLEASAQRTLTKAPLAKKNAPVEEEEAAAEEEGNKPVSKKGKTFATGRKTDDNAGAIIGGVVVGSLVLSLPFYWSNVKRFFGKYATIAKATACLSDGDETKAKRQQEDM